VVGFPIDHFLALDFAGFQKTIDVLGGVDIKVEKTFDDPQYPIEGKEEDTCGKTPEEVQATIATISGEKAQLEFPCRFEQLHFDKGITHMDGLTALKYVRSRHGDRDGGDFGRAARQRNLILAVKKRVLDINFIPKILPFISTISSHLKTDVSIKQIDEMLGQADAIKNYTIVNVALTDKNVLGFGNSADRQSILIPKAGQDNWDEVHALIEEELNKEASTAASLDKVSSTSSQIKN
jgi:anionic cell wall polymer biosynthesis LytR-Cps2A-Psr (LCP) family protein